MLAIGYDRQHRRHLPREGPRLDKCGGKNERMRKRDPERMRCKTLRVNFRTHTHINALNSVNIHKRSIPKCLMKNKLI